MLFCGVCFHSQLLFYPASSHQTTPLDDTLYSTDDEQTAKPNPSIIGL